MSLISDALKTAQRERTERVGAPSGERNLAEGFFPVARPGQEEVTSRRAWFITLAVVAVVMIGGATVARLRKPAALPPVKPIVLPALPNESANAAPAGPAPVLAIKPAALPASEVDSHTQRQISASVAAAPIEQRASVRREDNPTQAVTASVAAAPKGAVVKTTVDSALSAPLPKTAVVSTPPARSTPDVMSSRQPVRVTVEGGGRQPADLVASEALLAQQQGNLDHAQELYERAIAGTPTADVFNNYGVLLLQRGDSAAAILMYRRAVKLDPNKVEAWANLGEALDQHGIHAEATGAFQQVLRLDPTNVRARIQLAAQYSAIGSTSDARRILDEVTRSMPRDPAGHYALAGFLVSQRELSAAIREFDQFLLLAPGVYDQKTIDGVKSYVASIRARP
jgi:Tfp pilus assembly protein PilF